MATLAVSMEGISKHFGPVQALNRVSFRAAVGEVHGLVGENGAGKSTLIKILSGTVVPDSGHIELFGKPVSLRSPLDAQALGVQTVFQELTLIPDLTVADNLLNLREGGRLYARTSARSLVAQAAEILAELGVEGIDPAAYVRDLALPQRQMVEIVKAVARRPRILVLDEATSALLAPQVEWLFGLVQRLASQGTTVLFTSHRWDVVKRLTASLTVFRNGEYVGTYPTAELDEDQATTLMTGRRIAALYPPKPVPRADVRLAVRHLRSDVLRDISFDLHAGEILGIGGLQGQGQLELFLALFGAVPVQGTFAVDGRPVRIASPADAIRQGIGIGLVPEDRKTEGLFLSLSILENVSLPTLSRMSRFGFVRRAQQRALFETATRRLGIKLADINQSVGELSGGNQQKVVLAKWLAADARILLLYDVTRGVDVGTKHDIYELMAELAATGMAILFYSSETTEVVHMAHRVLVLYEGGVRDELTGDALTLERVVGTFLRGTSEAVHG